MTAQEALSHITNRLLEIYDFGEALSIAGIVLEDAFGIKPSRIKTDPLLNNDRQQELESIITRLLVHEPVQYVLGKTVFFGLPFKVTPAVLIPRQETEELVDWVIKTIGYSGTSPRVLDIGTGSGCIPVVLKKKLPGVEVHALDVSEGALKVATENARLNKVDVRFHKVDILSESAWETLPVFDIIVSNPPYITEAEKDILPQNVIDFEPHLALFAGGDDAQRFVKKIVAFAGEKLTPGGWLFFETNEFYAADTKRIMEEEGFGAVEIRKDLNGKDRMIRGGFN